MIDIIPMPLNVAFNTGQFRVRPGTRVEHSESALAPIVDRFRQDVARRTELPLEAAQIVPGTPADDVHSIRAELAGDAGLESLPTPIGILPGGEIARDESYSLTVGPDCIVVRGVEPVGVAHGLTTLVQLLATAPSSADGAVLLRAMHILDVARFAWRNLHLDVARTFFTVEELKRVIDLLALYKLNALSLHLTDDQAWRIEAGRPAGCTDAPFYTNAELRELIRYADERFIALIPLVNTPGHVGALVQMRPELNSGRNILETDKKQQRVARSRTTGDISDGQGGADRDRRSLPRTVHLHRRR